MPVGLTLLTLVSAFACLGTLALVCSARPSAYWQGEKSAVEEDIDWSVFLPEGEGRTEVALSCVGCHDLRLVIIQKKSKIGWRTSLQKMISEYKAPVDREDFQVLVAYLSANFGDKNPLEQLPMNINRSSAESLARMPGINPDVASAIVESRGSEGAFASIEDLLRVKGLDRTTFDRIKRYVTTKD